MIDGTMLRLLDLSTLPGGRTYGWSANAEGAALDALDASTRALHRRTDCGRHRWSNRPKAPWALDRSSHQRHDRCRHAHHRGGRGGACLAPPRPTPGPATRRRRARRSGAWSSRRGDWQLTGCPINLAHTLWGRAGEPNRFPVQWVRLGSRPSEQRRPFSPGRRRGIRDHSWSHKTGGRICDDSRDTPYLCRDPWSTEGPGGWRPAPRCWPDGRSRAGVNGGAPTAQRGRTTWTPARAVAGSAQRGQDPGSAHRDHLRAGYGWCGDGGGARAPSLILVRGQMARRRDD